MFKHGRESLVKDEGTHVSKEPLRDLNLAKKREWMERQSKAGKTTKYLYSISNNAYNVPRMTDINEKQMRISEEKMSGVPLEPLMLKNMDAAGRDKIIDAFAHFYADMHSYEPITNPVKYKMSYEMDFDALMDFVNGDMKKYFPKSDVSFVRKFYDHLAEIEYDSRLVWSHCDLFSGNVLYDSKKQKVSFIDFADVGYVFLQYDLLTPYLWDLGIANEVYERYLQYIKLKNLPVDATDKEKIKKISQYHHAIQILLDMDSDAKLFEMNNAEGKARIAERMRKMLAELHRIDFRN